MQTILHPEFSWTVEFEIENAVAGVVSCCSVLMAAGVHVDIAVVEVVVLIASEIPPRPWSEELAKTSRNLIFSSAGSRENIAESHSILQCFGPSRGHSDLLEASWNLLKQVAASKNTLSGVGCGPCAFQSPQEFLKVGPGGFGTSICMER